MNPHGWPQYPYHPDAVADAEWRRTAPLHDLEARVAEFCDEWRVCPSDGCSGRLDDDLYCAICGRIDGRKPL